MGLLIDIGSGKRGAGPGAIVFWLVFGAALGVGLPQMLPNPPSESRGYALALIGGVLGIAIGFYATWATSKLARILAVPGIIVDVVRFPVDALIGITGGGRRADKP